MIFHRNMTLLFVSRPTSKQTLNKIAKYHVYTKSAAKIHVCPLFTGSFAAVTKFEITKVIILVIRLLVDIIAFPHLNLSRALVPWASTKAMSLLNVGEVKNRATCSRTIRKSNRIDVGQIRRTLELFGIVGYSRMKTKRINYWLPKHSFWPIKYQFEINSIISEYILKSLLSLLFFESS